MIDIFRTASILNSFEYFFLVGILILQLRCLSLNWTVPSIQPHHLRMVAVTAQKKPCVNLLLSTLKVDLKLKIFSFAVPIQLHTVYPVQQLQEWELHLPDFPVVRVSY